MATVIVTLTVTIYAILMIGSFIDINSVRDILRRK
jgi:hypothetical protein